MSSLTEQHMSEHLDSLKEALIGLKAAGADGFEGFVRIALATLTGIPFRLAASGLQGGIDGDAAFKGDAVSFEAKRYSGNISRNDVLTKIVDFARHKDAPDRLWVLGATTEISAQLAAAVQDAGNNNAISTLIIDWTHSPLPLLAVAAVAAGEEAINFLTTNSRSTPNREKLSQAFSDISRHPEFDHLLKNLRSNLNVSTLATARSTALNREWRAASFGSETVARERLGQALAVKAQLELPELRTTERDQVKKVLQTGQSVVLSGGEGHGKSWLAAQICCDHEGVALFASAEQFENIAPKDLDEYLLDTLIQQTCDMQDDATRKRWRHRLTAWKSQPPAHGLLLVIDGINQRQSIRWDRILNSLHERLCAIGGFLVVTVRPQFWLKTVAPGITFKPKTIEVPEWSSDERNQLLRHYGIELDWLDDATLKTLRNPRLLGVAVATLPHSYSAVWKGLTTDRLLLEHLRASQRENFEEETLTELTDRLSTHAKAVLERVRSSSSKPSQTFEADSTAVIETRFFRTLPGPGRMYELSDEGLTLALGYALVDQLWQATQSTLDLDAHIVNLIEPIHAMDRTVDVMFSSLMVCARDPVRFTKAIFSVLLDAFSNLQNINDQRFAEFVEIVKWQPTEFFGVLRSLSLERGRRLNQDWFIHAAFEIASTEKGGAAAEDAVHQWLHCYNADAIDQANRFGRRNDNDDGKHLHRRQDDIQEVLLSLSPFERELLEDMTEVSGETDSLFALALQLIAGRPLAGFADSFIALGLGFALDPDTLHSQKMFRQLTTFNSVDRGSASEAFQKAIEPLRASNTSRAGKWTVVRMLRATGEEAAALEAATIAQALRDDWHSWDGPSSQQWRHVRIADPNAAEPLDLDEGLRTFRAIRADSVMQTMWVGADDREFAMFLPVACRFAPELAIDRTRQILAELLTRTAMPLRQLIFNGMDYAPLVTRDLAAQVMSRATGTAMVETLRERERDVALMLLFGYLAPHLTASEQLDSMAHSAFGSDCLLTVIPSLKAQSTEVIVSALRGALDANDEAAAYGCLMAARYGNTAVTPDLELLVLRCQRSHTSKLRGIAFDLAVHSDSRVLRDSHVRGDWSAETRDERSYENWFGSMLLIEACAKKEFPVDALLKRIRPEMWFAAAERIGETIAKPLSNHFLNRLQGAVAATKSLSQPRVSLTLSEAEPAPYPFLSVDESDSDNGRFTRQKELHEALKDDKAFDEKQDRLHEIAKAFFQALDGSDACLAVERVTIDDIDLLARTDPKFLERMLGTLEQASNSELGWLRNLAYIVACLVSKDMPDRAVALFQKAAQSQGFVDYSLHDNLTVEHQAIWSSAPSEAVNKIWRQRIRESGNDEILAREVLAAERFGAANFINALVEELADSASTLDKAYAISIAGFSAQSEKFIAVIERHLDDLGITGSAARKAKAVHEAARWAKKWVSDMWCARCPEEFWRCLIISKVCMDARVSKDQISGTKWGAYAPIFRSVRRAAIKEHQKTREKTFLGQEVPNKVFVIGY